MYQFSGIKKLLFSLFLLGASLNAMELNWEHNFQHALNSAQKEKKMVYFFIGADKCRYCDKFKKETLSNKKLIETMKKEYVLLYMSRDQHAIPNGFEKYGVPMHYFLTSEGKIIAKVQGSRELAGWYDVLDEIDLMKDN